MKIHGMVEDSIVDGDGIRLALFMQGCIHCCKGCHTPQVWSYEGYKEVKWQEVAEKVINNPLCAGITITGGEPFTHADADMQELLNAIKLANKTVWIYTGYTMSELERIVFDEQNPYQYAMFSRADVIVDGKYEEALFGAEPRFRGSSNQRIWLNIGTSDPSFTDVSSKYNTGNQSQHY